MCLLSRILQIFGSKWSPRHPNFSINTFASESKTEATGEDTGTKKDDPVPSLRKPAHEVETLRHLPTGHEHRPSRADFEGFAEEVCDDVEEGADGCESEENRDRRSHTEPRIPRVQTVGDRLLGQRLVRLGAAAAVGFIFR
jgi:hypothetical protein